MLKFPNIDPIILPLGPLAISWYSLSYVVGILLGVYYILGILKNSDKYLKSKSVRGAKKIKRNLTSSAAGNAITKQHIDEFVSWVIIGIIIGGRLGHVLFYDPVKYFSDPIQILKTYEGGMSFHGGIIGFIIASYLFTRRKVVYFLALTDLCAVAAPIALGLGRIANFINAELYGRVTNVPWAFVFPYSDGMPRHPSQLYQAFFEGLVTFLILRFAVVKTGKLNRLGFASGLFLVLYAIFRIFIEFFREVDVQLGYFANYFTLGQILCLPMLVMGLYLIHISKNEWQSVFA